MHKTQNKRSKQLSETLVKKFDDRGLCFSLENREVKLLRKRFLNSETRGLNKYELKQALWECAKLEIDDKDLDDIFLKINSEGNGIATWDEFISYLILSFNIDRVSPEIKSLYQPIHKKPKLYLSHHKFPISNIVFNFEVKQDRTYSYNDGNYVTCSKDGTINYWSLDYALERTELSSSPDLKLTGTSILSICCLSDVRIICTAATERDLRFYDTSAKKLFVLRIHIKAMDYAVSAMDYVFPKNPHEESKLILGNTNGDVIVLFFVPFNKGPFKSSINSSLITVNFCNLTKNIPKIRIVKLKNFHKDMIGQIEWYTNLELIISVSSNLGMVMQDIRDERIFKYHMHMGALCFRAHNEFPLIATGGNDTLIRIWNPYLTKLPISILSGHHSAVIYIAIQDGGEVLLSLSMDKVIKIWNINDRTCIQNYLCLGPELAMSNTIVMFYNPGNRQITIGGTVILVLDFQTLPDGEHSDGTSHVEGISAALYNPVFKIIVTCSLDSDIIVWDPWLGRRRTVIRNAHTMLLNGELVPVEITAATFDEKYQYLLTGAHDGSLKTWNFNSGTCIRHLKLENNCEVTGVSWSNKRILAIGWNNYVTEFFDAAHGYETGHFFKKWKKLHETDVLCAVSKPKETFVTAAYNGDLILWSYETGQPYKRYNIVEPTTRITLTHKYVKIPKIVRGHKTSAYLHAVELSRKIKFTEKRPNNFRRMAVRCMLILQNRPAIPTVGSLLVSEESGRIQVYSHHKSGGFLFGFMGVHTSGDCITSMASDKENEYLICGSSEGYIIIFLLKNFYSNIIENICWPSYRLKFPFLWKTLFLGRAKRRLKNQLPHLLNSFKAHRKIIATITYIDSNELIVTGSTDASARIFHISGRYLGVLGTFKPWIQITHNVPLKKEHGYRIPADIKRIASSTSLKVFLGESYQVTLTKRQRKLFFERSKTEISSHIVFGKRLDTPILGNHFKRSRKEIAQNVFNFDENSDAICLYQNLTLHTPRPFKKVVPAKDHVHKKYETIYDIMPHLANDLII